MKRKLSIVTILKRVTPYFLSGCPLLLYYSKNEKAKEVFPCIAGAFLAELFCHPVDSFNMYSKSQKMSKSPQKPLSIKRCFSGASYIVKYYSVSMALFYFLYHFLRRALKNNFSLLSESAAISISAFISELAFIVVFYPFERLKTLAQVVPKERRSDITFYKIYLKDRGLISCIKTSYRASSRYALTYSIYAAIQFGIYSATMKFLKNKFTTEQINIAIASVLGGTIGSIFTNSLEVSTVLKQVSTENSKIYLFKYWKQGLFYRIFYNSMMSLLMFLFIEKLSELSGIKFNS